jgi:hypothetical protein
VKRLFAFVLMTFVFVGCGVNPAPIKPANPSSPSSDATTFPIDYTGWPQLTEKPVHLPERLLSDCRDAATIRRSLGPHDYTAARTSIRYYVTPSSEIAVRKHLSPVPVGTVVIKEKWTSELTDEISRLSAIAAMVKREPGYAETNGDWEYVYAERVAAENRWSINRGQLPTCVECHSGTWTTDYLFGTSFTPLPKSTP